MGGTRTQESTHATRVTSLFQDTSLGFCLPCYQSETIFPQSIISPTNRLASTITATIIHLLGCRRSWCCGCCGSLLVSTRKVLRPRGRTRTPTVPLRPYRRWSCCIGCC